MERIKQIVTQLKRIAKESNMTDISQDCLFSESVKIYLSQVIQENKEKNMNNFKKEKIEEKPTEKQISFLKKNKIDTTNITKQEAFKLIEETIKKLKNKKKIDTSLKESDYY